MRMKGSVLAVTVLMIVSCAAGTALAGQIRSE